MKEVGLSLPKVGVFTETSLEIEQRLEKGQWVDLIHKLVDLRRANAWWIGDALNYAAANYRDFSPNAAAAELGYSLHAVRVFMLTCKAYPPGTRHEGLSMRHHTEARRISIDSRRRDQILTKAERLNLSVDRMSREIGGVKTAPSRTPGKTPLEKMLNMWEELTEAEKIEFLRRVNDRRSWRVA